MWQRRMKIDGLVDRTDVMEWVGWIELVAAVWLGASRSTE